MQTFADELRMQGKRIGVVPTMGYLHDGHLSLINIAKQHADIVITTIYVNPMQFAQHEDLTRYPRNLERDVQLAEMAGSDFLFLPEDNKMYPVNFKSYIELNEVTATMEGLFRPDHFRGVTTVVAKLFNITKPHVAVFGQKDAQQSVVIKRMTRDLNFDIEIMIAPTVREADGLAMSSRNTYLTPSERKEALILSRSLNLAHELIRNGERNANSILYHMHREFERVPGVKAEYISVVDAESLGQVDTIDESKTILIALAARVGSTRLIDNILIDFQRNDHE